MTPNHALEPTAAGGLRRLAVPPSLGSSAAALREHWAPGETRGHGLRRMKKVAVFGNAAGGKSTLARRLAELTRLPLYPLDTIQYRRGGGKVPHEEYLRAHADLLARDQWIIDGFGSVPSAWERFAAADTLIYIDLSLFTHYRWVTKRLVKGLFLNPEGWPENSPIWSSTLSSYRVVGRCHRDLTPRYRQLVADAASTKRVHHLRAPAEMRSFLAAIDREYRTRAMNDAQPPVAADAPRAARRRTVA